MRCKANLIYNDRKGAYVWRIAEGDYKDFYIMDGGTSDPEIADTLTTIAESWGMKKDELDKGKSLGVDFFEISENGNEKSINIGKATAFEIA